MYHNADLGKDRGKHCYYDDHFQEFYFGCESCLTPDLILFLILNFTYFICLNSFWGVLRATCHGCVTADLNIKS